MILCVHACVSACALLCAHACDVHRACGDVSPSDRDHGLPCVFVHDDDDASGHDHDDVCDTDALFSRDGMPDCAAGTWPADQQQSVTR